MRPSNAPETDPQIVAAAHEVAGWLAATGTAGYRKWDDLPKFVASDGDRRTLVILRFQIALPLPPDQDLPRYRPQPRRHTTREQRDLVVQHWVYASTADATTSVAVARLDAGAENEWSAHIARGPYTQYIDRFEITPAPGLASSVAPRAAHVALIIADVLMPLQTELERIHGPRGAST